MKKLINRVRENVELVTTRDTAADWTRALAQAHDWLDREERLQQLTQPKRTLPDDIRHAA